jgi:hypothetical protein
VQAPDDLTLKCYAPIFQSPLDVGKHIEDARRDLPQRRLTAECSQSGHPTVGVQTGDVGHMPSEDTVGLTKHDDMADLKFAGRVS